MGRCIASIRASGRTPPIYSRSAAPRRLRVPPKPNGLVIHNMTVCREGDPGRGGLRGTRPALGNWED
eukprot:3218131-Pyramimonas_sp.AAC.1